MDAASEVAKKARKPRGPATLPTEAPPDAVLLSCAAMASKLMASVELVERWVSNGTIPSIKIGRLRRVKRVDFDRFVEGLK